MNRDVIILAAGKGSRMKSSTAKVLHRIGGMPMVDHVLQSAAQLQPQSINVVLGHQADTIRDHLDASSWAWREVVQAQQLGTGHAVKLALEGLDDEGIALVLYADVPLVNLAILEQCIAAAETGAVGLVTAVFDDAAELGRIIRDEREQIQAIVEYKDASAEQRAVREINSGILAAPTKLLKQWLERVAPNNNQGEYYLTDIIAMAVGDGIAVSGIVAEEPADVAGVNDRIQLAQLERVYQQRQVASLMRAGVSFADPQRVDIRGQLQAGQDCYVDVNAVFQGNVVLGAGVHIGPGAVLIDCQVGDGCVVHAHTVVEGAQVAANCSLGPFARIRPGSNLGEGVKIGNFVETKKATLGPGSKASHLAYLGDATIGAGCNIGAGSITCNYDGVDKHQTIIGDGAFIGTNSTLVAPLEIGSDSFTAAGSTVTASIGDQTLAVGRARQRNIENWLSPVARKKNSATD